MSSIQTVLGEIDQNAMGTTLPHEHLFVDLSCYWTGKESDPDKRALYSQPVTLQNRPEVIYNPWQFYDNTILDDMDSAVNEVRNFMDYGGKTIIDVTPSLGMGRNPQAIRQVSRDTGANIIMASGRYSGPSLTDEEKAHSVDVIEKMILREFENGVGDTGIKPGVLKVGFEAKLDKEWELNSLRAAARAQNKIGCALVVHPNIWDCESHIILDIIEAEGGDIRKTVLCHMDFTGGQSDYHDSLAKRGAFIEFDTFGCECVTGQRDWNLWYATDGQKIAWVLEQIQRRNLAHILLSGDMCQKLFFTKWGGWGYAHIPQHILPRMRSLGISEETIQILVVDNPQKAFCY